MKTKILLLVLTVGACVCLRAAPLGTSFTYQGQLITSNGVAQGPYDFHFSLFDAPGAGNRIGNTLSLSSIAVSNGLFTVMLDFGTGIFAGDARWLEIEVRPGGSVGNFALLLPRQPVSPSPYALFAPTAGTATSVAWSAITGMPAGFADGIDNDTTYAAGAGLALNGTTFSVASLGITSSMVADNSITAPKIAAGQVVTSLNGLHDAVSLAAGANVTLSPNGNTLTISGTGGFNVPYSASVFLDGTTVGKTVLAISNTAPSGYSDGIAGYSTSTDGTGLHGWATGTSGNNKGVFGRTSSPDGNAVRGENLAQLTVGVLGSRTEGVFGVSAANGVFGQSLAPFDGSGVLGRYDGSGLFNGGNGVFGYNSTVGVGVLGVSEGGDGVSGRSNAGSSSGVFGYAGGVQSVGVTGISEKGDGIRGESHAGDKSGVVGFSSQANGFGGFFYNGGGGLALVSAGPLDVRGDARLNDHNLYLRAGSDNNHGVGWRGDVDGPFLFGYNGGALGTIGPDNKALTWDWHGNVSVFASLTTPVLTITGGADLAEPFTLSSDEILPGAVVVIDEQHAGQLKQSERAYDTRVAGIVSGANGVNPGISLHQQGVLEGGKNVALTGRVYVQADDSNGPIKPGDLLTTSAVPGHAMKVTDHAKAQGAIIGKAMDSLLEGRGLVLVLVTLQ